MKTKVAYTTNECKLKYTQPQCLGGSGTQYIDTGIKLPTYATTLKGTQINRVKREQFGGAFAMVRQFGITDGFTVVKIEKVVYNDPATIVFWSDNTKTVAKTHDGDVYNAEMGLILCVLKKIATSESVYKLLEDWTPTQGNIVTMKDVRKKHK